MCAFHEEKSALSCPASLDRLCGRSNGGGRRVEFVNTSMEQSARMGRLRFVPAAVGFLLGIFFLLILDRVIPHLHMNATEPEGEKRFQAHNDACACGDASQYPRRNGCWRCIRRLGG